MKDYIFIRKKGNVVFKITHAQITHVQAMGDYCKIFTTEKVHVIHVTLGAITSILPSDVFYRCHRSFTINIDKIEMIEEYTAYIEKNDIPIGEQYKRGLLKLLNYVMTTSESKKTE